MVVGVVASDGGKGDAVRAGDGGSGVSPFGFDAGEPFTLPFGRVLRETEGVGVGVMALARCFLVPYFRSANVVSVFGNQRMTLKK
jgi:hypothetical protein